MIKIILISSLVAWSFSAGLEMKGINFVSVPYTQAPYSHINSKKSMEHLKETGANWISIPIAYFMDHVDDSKVVNLEFPMATRDRINATPSKKEISDVVIMAKSYDLKVMLMPVIEINQPGFFSSRHIGEHYSPFEFRRWFESYTDHLVKLAEFAEEIQVEMLCIGHNLFLLSTHEIFWNKLIEKIRGVYKGQLTYSASSKQEFKKSGFWGQLDMVGMIADFEYRNHHQLSEKEVETAMADFIKSAEYMSKVWKKPVFISRAFSHSAKDVSRENRVSKISHEAQAVFYKSLMKAAFEHPSIKGIFWGDWIADYRFGGTKDGSLSPQYKPSELILREYYQGKIELPEKPDSKTDHVMFCESCHNEQDIDL